MTVGTFDFYRPRFTVAAVDMYGLKSTAPTTHHGLPFQELQLGAAGFVGADIPDRWAVIGEVAGEGHAELVSQRVNRSPVNKATYAGDSALALVGTNIEENGKLMVGVPGFGEGVLDIDEADPNEAEVWEVNIHGRPYRAFRIGEVVTSHLTEFLHAANPDRPKREIGVFAPLPDDLGARELRYEYKRPTASWRIRGADGTAVHVLFDGTTRKIRQDQGLTDAQLSNANGRPNITLQGPVPPYAEDRVRTLEIRHGQTESVVLEPTGPTARCKVTEVDPKTGERTGTVLQALAKAGRKGWSTTTGVSSVFWGTGFQPQLHDYQHVTVAVGDPATLTLRPHSNISPQRLPQDRDNA